MSRREMVERVSTYVHAYRHLGPRRGTKAVARRVLAAGRGRLRRHRLSRRPLGVSDSELKTALGRRASAQALREAAVSVPSALRWEQSLDALSAGEAEDLLRRADQLVEHRFDLLGSGVVDLGPMIDWHRDFKSGRVWPLRHISQIPVSYPDESDIKVPWELSRGQHLPILAAAFRLTADTKYEHEIGAQLRSWIAANPVEFGVNWACTMDVAIRAVNWIATLVMVVRAGEATEWLDEVVSSLLLHGRFIRSHLESSDARGNHYLSDVVGLLLVSAVFITSDEGQAWAAWTIDELEREARHQVRADGCDHEASIAYHRLVTELFIVGADAADGVRPGSLAPSVRPTIEAMLRFVADYVRPDGLAPQIGDVDNGRLLPLGDYGTDQRSHLHLFRQADRPYVPATSPSAYRHGGFFFLRAESLYVAVRCGDVGLYGRGCHAHNDLLAFELCYGDTPLIIDPGSYLYTADQAARNLFRATRMHSTLQIDGEEQNELRDDRLFAMVDRAGAELLTWETTPGTVHFRGRHQGYKVLDPPAVHTRTLRLLAAARQLEVVDEVFSRNGHDLLWTFPLGDGVADVTNGHVVARYGAVTLLIDTGGLTAAVGETWYSPSYGKRLKGSVVQLRGRSRPGTYKQIVRLTVAG